MRKAILAAMLLAGCTSGEWGTSPKATLGGQPANATYRLVSAQPHTLLETTVTQGATQCVVAFPVTKGETSPAQAKCNDGRSGSGHALVSRPFGTFDLNYALSDGSTGYVRIAPQS